MTTTENIPRGYVIKARVIMESEISKAPPHVREIFDWLILNANHKDVRVSGTVIKRGQRMTSYHEICEALAWNIGFIKKRYSKDKCDRAMQWLRQKQMITTLKTTRGIIVTISNYDKYQNPANYERPLESDNETTMKRQSADTINKKPNNGNNDKNDTEARETEFRKEVFSFQNIYSDTMLTAFFNYWSEKNSNGKMRWEMEKTYEIKKRLTIWHSREKEETKPVVKGFNPFDLIPQ